MAQLFGSLFGAMRVLCLCFVKHRYKLPTHVNVEIREVGYRPLFASFGRDAKR